MCFLFPPSDEVSSSYVLYLAALPSCVRFASISLPAPRASPATTLTRNTSYSPHSSLTSCYTSASHNQGLCSACPRVRVSTVKDEPRQWQAAAVTPDHVHDGRPRLSYLHARRGRRVVLLPFRSVRPRLHDRPAPLPRPNVRPTVLRGLQPLPNPNDRPGERLAALDVLCLGFR